MQYDLTFAALRGNSKLVEKLLDAGCDVNEPCCMRRLALHEACSNSDRAIVELLLEHGAKPDLATKTWAKEGLTALHYVASGCRDRWAGRAPEAEPSETAKECMEILIEHGAAVDARNISQRTPLHLAVMLPSNDAEGVRNHYVNGVGADETIRDHQGNRAYECAKEEVIKRLIEPEDARLKREVHEEYIRRMNEDFDRRCQEHFEETGEYYWFTPDGD
ncbi:MAG: hypothetical protein M1840_001418 [Geoglossum simile]|nr:MAG: hypothetical protein M1840_001418 [Geoglossum simile]